MLDRWWESVSFIFQWVLHLWSSDIRSDIQMHPFRQFKRWFCSWAISDRLHSFSLTNERREMAPSPIYKLFSDIFAITSSCKPSVVSVTSVKIVSEHCQVLLCSQFVELQAEVFFWCHFLNARYRLLPPAGKQELFPRATFWPRWRWTEATQQSVQVLPGL